MRTFQRHDRIRWRLNNWIGEVVAAPGSDGMVRVQFSDGSVRYCNVEDIALVWKASPDMLTVPTDCEVEKARRGDDRGAPLSEEFFTVWMSLMGNERGDVTT